MYNGSYVYNNKCHATHVTNMLVPGVKKLALHQCAQIYIKYRKFKNWCIPIYGGESPLYNVPWEVHVMPSTKTFFLIVWVYVQLKRGQD